MIPRRHFRNRYRFSRVICGFHFQCSILRIHVVYTGFRDRYGNDGMGGTAMTTYAKSPATTSWRSSMPYTATNAATPSVYCDHFSGTAGKPELSSVTNHAHPRRREQQQYPLGFR
jgi:hypothetical protein